MKLEIKKLTSDLLEAYPVKGDADCYAHYHGPPALYEKQGFAQVEVSDVSGQSTGIVMRKEI